MCYRSKIDLYHVYFTTVTSALLAGKQYNRGVHAHKLVGEAFFRLSWKAFEKSLDERLSKREQPCVVKEEMFSVFSGCVFGNFK